MATYRVLEKMHLPFIKDTAGEPAGITKQAGDTVTSDELASAQQTDEDIASLIEYGAMEEV